MALYLIRHPQPLIEAGMCYGQTDLALLEPIESCLATVLVQLPHTFTLYSSPLQRCALLAHAIATTPIVDSRLQEMNFGRWELTPWDNIGAETMDAWISSGYGDQAHGGESYVAFQARVIAWLEELTHNTDTVVVTHAGVIRVLLAHLNGWSIEESLSHPLAFSSVTVVDLLGKNP